MVLSRQGVEADVPSSLDFFDQAPTVPDNLANESTLVRQREDPQRHRRNMHSSCRSRRRYKPGPFAIQVLTLCPDRSYRRSDTPPVNTNAHQTVHVPNPSSWSRQHQGDFVRREKASTGSFTPTLPLSPRSPRSRVTPPANSRRRPRKRKSKKKQSQKSRSCCSASFSFLRIEYRRRNGELISARSGRWTGARGPQPFFAANVRDHPITPESSCWVPRA